MRLYLIEERGLIIGTAPVGVREVKTTLPGTAVAATGEQAEEVLQVEVIPKALPGQTVHEVELPPELEGLEELDLLDALMTRYQIAPADAKLVERGISKR